jgi:hypothetical protein
MHPSEQIKGSFSAIHANASHQMGIHSINHLIKTSIRKISVIEKEKPRRSHIPNRAHKTRETA